MGFNSITPSINLVAKLTPLGRKRLVSTNNALITTFSLGDSDANYYATDPLNSGEVPSLAGNIGPMSATSNSVTNNIVLKSQLYVNAQGITKKNVESQSINIVTENVYNGFTTVSGANLTRLVIDRNSYDTNSYVNLYYTFGLPLNANNDFTFTGITNVNGGFSDTAYSALSTTKIGVFAIDNSTYGETIDAKTIKMELPTTAGTFTIYSTYENKNIPLNVEDAHTYETSINSQVIDDNIAFLFCDDINKPNSDSTLSWSTGWNTYKPFSLNTKQLFNFQTNPNLSLIADTIVGVAYLDKGIIVLTHPTIVNSIGELTSGATTGTTITFDSISTDIYQNITCIADRGEFGTSTNITIGAGDNPRISEVGLYDDLGNLIAVAKSDRHIIKNVNEFIALGIKISL